MEIDVKTFFVPDLGEGLEEVTLVTWDVRAGDTVELNQQLCVVETAKAEVEIPSPYGGLVVECVGEVGDTLPVGSPLIRIDTVPQASETPDERTAPDDASTGDASDDDEVKEESTTSPSNGRSASAETAPEDSQPEPAEVRDPPRRTAVLVGYGIDSDIDSSRRVSRSSTSGAAVASEESAPSSRPRAKPAARQLARSLDVDLASMATGSGIDGAIVRADVVAAAKPAIGAAGTDRETDSIVSVFGIRARIAERMSRSRQEIPDAHASVFVDCSELLNTRALLQAEVDEVKISPFTLILRLLITVLSRNPTLNARWTSEDGQSAIITHSSINLGFGAATPRGLVVPVVRNAEQLTTVELAREVHRLISGARDATLRPNDLTGSTFTVSNFGALGLDDGVPVINYPEAAILGLGTIRDQVVAVDGTILIRPTMRITCAFDHRIADGADVATLLTGLRDLIESPQLALLHL